MSDHFSIWVIPLCALAGVVLDRVFGELPRFHPLVGFGQWANRLEKSLNHRRISLGLAAWCLAVLPFVGLAIYLRMFWPVVTDIVLLYFALGAQSLFEHAQLIARPLAAGDLPAARERVGWIVSRDTAAMSETDVAKAAVESVLENGNDAIFATLFWFALLGGPGVVLFRLANTLDAMWGYRTERFNLFGRVAARIDDLLNYLPARLTALTYALFGSTRASLRSWQTQAPRWDSPNAGPVMAAGAGALQIRLGGAAMYHGQREQRPSLGAGPAPKANDITRAIRLVQRGMWFWLAAFFLIAAAVAMIVAMTGASHA